MFEETPPSSEVARNFDWLAPTLLGFAADHSLVVRKYPHKYAMWCFHFLHPAGGSGMIQIHAMPVRENLAKSAIHAHWWLDDYTTLTRKSYTTKVASVDVDTPEQLVPYLERALGDLLALKPTVLEQTSPIMPRAQDRAGNPVLSDFERVQQIPT